MHTIKTAIGFLLSFFLVSSNAFCQNRGDKLVLVCGDSKIHLVDYEKSANGIPEIIWTWDAQLAEDLPEDFRTKKFNSIDDCKAIHGGEQILVSSSSGAVAILMTATREVVFFANVPNAHSIEILPENRLIAAASTNPNGNKIMLFDTSHPDALLYTDSLYSAHGLVWVDKMKRLFALGYDVLREYTLPSKDSLSLKNEWKIPGRSGHDLYPSSDGKKLYLTVHEGVWIFDLDSHAFSKIEGFPDAENIKSVGDDPSGQFVFTVPEESWWTHHVSFFQPTNKLAFPGMRVYKARWFW